jgi:hypothetical protein
MSSYISATEMQATYQLRCKANKFYFSFCNAWNYLSMRTSRIRWQAHVGFKINLHDLTKTNNQLRFQNHSQV